MSSADKKVKRITQQRITHLTEARKEISAGEKGGEESKALKRALKSLWEAYDLDGNNVLDLDEQEAFFSDVYDYIYDFSPLENSESALDAKTEVVTSWRLKFDSNHDDELSWDEFKTSMSLLRSAAGLSVSSVAALPSPHDPGPHTRGQRFLHGTVALCDSRTRCTRLHR